MTAQPKEPEQEPVDFEALIVDIECIDCRYRGDPSYDRDAYWMRDEVIAAIKRHSSYYTTATPQHSAIARKPLTDEQIMEIWVEHGCEGEDAEGFARAIEAAHGIKE